MLSFVSHLLGVKSEQAVNGAIETLVRWDPKSATEAELRSMEEHLDQLGRQVAEARTAYERERKEADAIQALSQQRMAAAERLQRQTEGETDPARKTALDKSLTTLVELLESMAPDLDREARDAADAKDFLEMLEKTYADTGAKLKEAKAGLDRAHRDMRRAEQQREMAERQAEGARRAAGLSSATGSLGMALKAMQDAAARDLAEAEAAKAKARLLTTAEPERDDPNIAEAMAATSGALPPPTNLGERLARLRDMR